MKTLRDWGITTESWKGSRGEYWVLMQGLLMVGFVLLPVYRPAVLAVSQPVMYSLWAIATLLAVSALVLMGKGLLDLGQSLTPLPYPRSDGQLVQTGVYGIVRHSLYSGLILGAAAWTLYSLSLSHLLGTVVLFLFFNAKASQEERWLCDRYPDYDAYRQRVKKLIPWVY